MIDSAAAVVAQVRSQSAGAGDSLLDAEMDRLVVAIDEVGPLSPIGRRILAEEMRRALVGRARLRSSNCARQEWATRGEDLVIICGLPRSGSTALHRMLTLFPGLVGPVLRSIFIPLDAGSATGAVDRRLQLLRAVAPSFALRHPMAPDQVEECIVPLVTSGCFALLDLFVHAPGAGIDAMPLALRRQTIAEYFGRHLPQLVAPGHKTTVVKSPFHSMWLTEILEVLPAARIITLSRPLEAVIPSWNSLVEESVIASRTEIDPRGFALSWLQRWALVDAQMGALGALDRVLPIAWESLRSDSEGVVASVASWIGLASEDTRHGRGAVKRWLESNPPEAFGSVQYTERSQGLSRDDFVVARRRAQQLLLR